jgi:hypothetical protein
MKSTVIERMTLGRDRLVKGGRWIGGPVPLRYALDERGFLMPSACIVEAVGMIGADFTRDLFRRIAEGSTLLAVCRRLNALGVMLPARFRGGRRSGGKRDGIRRALPTSCIIRSISGTIATAVNTGQ